MPSPFAHASAGYFIYRLYKPNLLDNQRDILKIPSQLIILSILSLLPDLDILPGILMKDLAKFHNNASHSFIIGIFTAIILSVFASRIIKLPIKSWFMATFISYELHIIMDFFTGDRGEMLLWPLSSTRFNSPVRLFIGVQWGNGLISSWHFWTIFTEILFFIPILILTILLERHRVKKSITHNTPR